jgi:hypothetical protein
MMYASAARYRNPLEASRTEIVSKVAAPTGNCGQADTANETPASRRNLLVRGEFHDT